MVSLTRFCERLKESLRNKQRKDSTVKSEAGKPVDVDALKER